jgi:hypothetical protein
VFFCFLVILSFSELNGLASVRIEVFSAFLFDASKIISLGSQLVDIFLNKLVKKTLLKLI